jgi:hypothetical protein
MKNERTVITLDIHLTGISTHSKYNIT